MTNDHDMPQATRRRFLIDTAALAGAAGIGLSLATGPASATPASMRAAIRKVVGEAPVKKGRVKIDLPPLIENGNAVPLTVTAESPMTADDHVKAIHVFTEKNPQPNVISVQFGPRAGRATFSTRIRLADSQKVDRHRRNERRLVLVGRDRGHRHAGGVPGRSLIMARALINVPPKAKRGEVIEIKTLISHDMETGFRPDNTGKAMPRDIITEFVCKYNGEEIFRAELFPAISANPFLTFFTIATESGTLNFEWTGDNGFSASESANITVE